MDFDLPDERPIDDSVSGDFDISRRNLMEIEDRIQLRMAQIAKEVGGKYVSPSASEIMSKVNETIDDKGVFYTVDSNKDIIWAPYGKFGRGPKNAEQYNKSGKFGFIVREKNRKEKDVSTLRVYRGCNFDPKVKQVAPLARLEGISVQDIYDYTNGLITMDEILAKNKDDDKYLRQYLENSLQKHRERMKKYGTTEFEEIAVWHTAFTPGAVAIDLWVSAAYDPKDAYGHGNGANGKNLYGDFLRKNGIQSVLVLDVPESMIQRYGEEVGILGEIKPEYIRAIVPSSGNSTGNVRKAEVYLEKMDKAV